jgi:hypothetical protein
MLKTLRSRKGGKNFKIKILNNFATENTFDYNLNNNKDYQEKKYFDIGCLKLIFAGNVGRFQDLENFLKAIEFFENEVESPKSVVPIFHDLYPVRHTNQKEFVKFLEDNADFRKKLDEATKNLIDGIMPDIIVIANAKASELMQKIFFGESEAEKIKLKRKTKCTYRLNGQKTEMIFSSMLSGQRALDTYSRTRLAREISKTWKDRNN